MILRNMFEQLVKEGVEAIPVKFRGRIRNLVFLVEDEPSEEVRRQEELLHSETLLGLYSGIPISERGSDYGVGPTLPDTIFIYQKPIEEAAAGDTALLRQIVIDTVWHEVGHYLGLDEAEVERREQERGIGDEYRHE